MFKRRHLIVKRRENLTEGERDDLTRMLEYLPALATLRRFADRISWVFDTPKDWHQASCRRVPIVRDPAFLAVPELVKAMKQLDGEKFAKLMAYLNNPVSRRVRTNNHVERTKRMFRFLEKVRYKWRRPADAGAVRGADAGWDLAGLDCGRAEEERTFRSSRVRQVANPVQTTVKLCRMRSRW